MKVAVIGAGIAGVTTAYELTLDGHEVAVFERRHTAAEESSFANGGVIAPGWLAPLHAPAGARGWLAPWTSPVGGLQLAGRLSAAQWRWLWRWKRAGKTPDAARRLDMQRLAAYSQARMAAISAERDWTYDRAQGLLVLLRSPREAAQAQPALQWMRDHGVAFRELLADEARQIEPAINPETPLHGAIELGEAETANCRQFALLLKAEAQALGCRFQFGTAVQRLDTVGGIGLALSGPAGEPATHERFDAVVLCAGPASAALLQPLGLSLPLQPVYGHSISAAIREPLDTPASGVLDALHQVSITRLGQRVRVAGGYRLGRQAAQKSAPELLRLYQVLSDWFPGAARLADTRTHVQEWVGAQAMLPDGPPLVGESGLPGVWLNLGHGASGWAMACGSARALADRLAGGLPDIDLAGLSIQRLHR